MRMCRINVACKRSQAVYAVTERPWQFTPLTGDARLVCCEQCKVEIERRVNMENTGPPGHSGRPENGAIIASDILLMEVENGVFDGLRGAGNGADIGTVPDVEGGG